MMQVKQTLNTQWTKSQKAMSEIQTNIPMFLKEKKAFAEQTMALLTQSFVSFQTNLKSNEPLRKTYIQHASAVCRCKTHDL